MKETQVANAMPFQQHFSSWSGTHTKNSVATEARDDIEPFRKPPVPSAFRATEVLSHFQTDPLLLVTPEKSLGLARLDRNNSATTEEFSVNNEDVRRGRQRVRFAPGTQTASPPALSKNSSGSDAGVVGVGAAEERGGVDKDSVPRNFSSVSQRLYQPARYVDSDEETSIKTVFPQSSVPLTNTAAAPKRYFVESRGNGSTVYVPMDQSGKKHISSGVMGKRESSEKTVKTKVICHKPPNSAEDSDSCEGSDAEVTETFSHPHASPAQKSPITLSRTASVSPHRNRPSSRQSSPGAKSPCRSPSSKSPSRLTPTGGISEVFSFSEDEPQPDVRVVREAPLRPKLNDYVFPFHSEKEESAQVYDSTKETPLARPEFNSTVKITEELKSVKARRPDTWGAVTETLRKSDQKRTQIQEKASSKVNVQLQSGLFSGLVDVDVPLDDLCHNLEQGITLRAPPTMPAPAKVVVGREPDLMEFFSSDIQQELPDLTLTGIQPVMERLTTANPTLAFDLYRHNRSWGGLTDS